MPPKDSRPIPDPTELTTEQLQREIRGLRELLEARLEAAEDARESQRVFFVGVLEERDRLYVERDRRYAERYDASQRAVDAALVAAEKAVVAAFESREKALKDAFDAADKAILKSEQAVEKRADASYVALNQLQALLANLLPRAEAEQRFKDLQDRLGTANTRLTAIEATKAGSTEQRGIGRDNLALIFTIIVVVMGVISFLAARGLK